MVNQEFVETAKELTINIIKRLVDTKETLQLGDGENFSRRLIYITEDLQTLVDALHVINEQEGNNPFNLEELSEKLENLLEQVEQKNYLLISDYIQFELLPLLEYWSESLTYVH